MGSYLKLWEEIIDVCEVYLRVPNVEEIDELSELNMPDYFIDFYSEYVPIFCTFIGSIKLIPPDDLVEENTNCVPGADVYKTGFTVFASTEEGNAYCFDMNSKNEEDEHDIYLISCTVNFENTSYEYIIRNSKFIGASFKDFIKKEILEESNYEDINDDNN